MKICLDIDGVITNTLRVWLEIIEQKYGVKAEKHQITQWELHKCEPLTQLSPQQIYGVLDQPGFYYNLPFLHYACPKVLERLNSKHEIYLVTARTNAERETRLWMADKLPFLKQEQLVFCANKSLIQADLIIDDRAENIEKYMETHPNSDWLIVEYAYNKRLWRTGWSTCGGDWHELGQLVGRIERKRNGKKETQTRPKPQDTRLATRRNN